MQQLVLEDTLNEDGKCIRREEESAATTQQIRQPATVEVPTSKKKRTKSSSTKPTRSQPQRKSRSVKSRTEFRDSLYPGSIYHQEIRTGEIFKKYKNIGIQRFQKNSRFDKGYRTLRGKYVQTTTFLARQLEKSKPDLMREHQSKF